jgi:hypothetical protein
MLARKEEVSASLPWHTYLSRTFPTLPFSEELSNPCTTVIGLWREGLELLVANQMISLDNLKLEQRSRIGRVWLCDFVLSTQRKEAHHCAKVFFFNSFG